VAEAEKVELDTENIDSSDKVIDAGEYKFIAKIDSSEDVAELDETNNEALSECFVIE